MPATFYFKSREPRLPVRELDSSVEEQERGWKDEPPAKAAFAQAAAEIPNLLRRPILVRGKRAVVGKDLDAIRDLLA